MTLNSKTVEQLIDFRNKGYSYANLSKKFGISKATAHKYTSNIILSYDSKKRILQKITRNRRKFVKKYAKLKKVPKRGKWGINKIRIISHCLFDGSVTKYNVNYTNSSWDLVSQFIHDMYEVYGIRPTSIDKIMSRNIDIVKYTVYYCSKNICKDLMLYTPSYSTASNISKIPEKMYSSSKSSIIEFLKAFWEDEGCITIKGQILARIKSKKIRNQLLDFHKIVGLDCFSYDCSDGAYGIRISSKTSSIIKFASSICFEKSKIVRGFNVGFLKRDLFNEIYKDRINMKGR